MDTAERRMLVSGFAILLSMMSCDCIERDRLPASAEVEHFFLLLQSDKLDVASACSALREADLAIWDNLTVVLQALVFLEGKRVAGDECSAVIRDLRDPLVEGYSIAASLSDIQRAYVRVLLGAPDVGRPILLEAIEGGSSLAALALEGLAREEYKGQDFLEVLAGVVSCEEREEDLRVDAVQVLGRIAPPEPPWSAVLTAALSDRSAKVRAAAAEAIRNR